MKKGYRSLSIASINPDTFAAKESQLQVVQMIQQRKIHIAAIQETHIPYDQNFKLSGYRIITSKAIQQNAGQQGIATGGVAILVHEELEQRKVQIHRIDHRILKITLHSPESHTHP